MSMDSIDPDANPDINIQEFSQNDNLFRVEVTPLDVDLVQRVTFDQISTPEQYSLFTLNLSQVVMIDLGDVFKFLKIKKQTAFDSINIRLIAEIVCDHLGDESEFHHNLFEEFNEEVAAIIVAELDLGEFVTNMAIPYDNAMEVVTAIATLIKRYLINAGYPIIEGESIYKVAAFQNGIIGLKLRTFEELEIEYGG